MLSMDRIVWWWWRLLNGWWVAVCGYTRISCAEYNIMLAIRYQIPTRTRLYLTCKQWLSCNKQHSEIGIAHRKLSQWTSDGATGPGDRMNSIVCRIACNASRTWLVADSSSGRWWVTLFIVNIFKRDCCSREMMGILHYGRAMIDDREENKEKGCAVEELRITFWNFVFIASLNYSCYYFLEKAYTTKGKLSFGTQAPSTVVVTRPLVNNDQPQQASDHGVSPILHLSLYPHNNLPGRNSRRKILRPRRTQRLSIQQRGWMEGGLCKDEETD